jgi:hypothetical protein
MEPSFYNQSRRKMRAWRKRGARSTSTDGT